MSLDPNMLEKIKKCLALSTSSNPHEAATALRHAHALMEKHGVSAHEITMSDIGESKVDSKTMSRDKPAQWETKLASVVGKAFGCQMMISKFVLNKRHLNEGQYIFVGLKHQVEIAAYTATVLIRKCKKSRQQWLSENMAGLGRGIPGAKSKMTRMGDAFAEGWVHSIGKVVADFAIPPEIDAAIAQHIAAQATGEEAGRPIRGGIGAHESTALLMGMRAAKGESLYRPMNTEDAPLALKG